MASVLHAYSCVITARNCYAFLLSAIPVCMVQHCMCFSQNTKQNAERLYGVGAILDAEDPACCAGM
jgi:hypothetical protein